MKGKYLFSSINTLAEIKFLFENSKCNTIFKKEIIKIANTNNVIVTIACLGSITLARAAA